MERFGHRIKAYLMRFTFPVFVASVAHPLVTDPLVYLVYEVHLPNVRLCYGCGQADFGKCEIEPKFAMNCFDIHVIVSGKDTMHFPPKCHSFT